MLWATYTLDSMQGEGAGHSKLEFHLNLWRFWWRASHCSWVKISQQRNTTEDTLGVIQVSRRISGQLHSKSWPRPCFQQIILANSGVTETIDFLQVLCAAGWKHGWRRCQLFLSMYVKLSVSLHTSLPTGILANSARRTVNQGATRDLIFALKQFKMKEWGIIALKTRLAGSSSSWSSCYLFSHQTTAATSEFETWQHVGFSPPSPKS